MLWSADQSHGGKAGALKSLQAPAFLGVATMLIGSPCALSKLFIFSLHVISSITLLILSFSSIVLFFLLHRIFYC